MTETQLQQIHALAEDIKKQGYHSVCFWMPCYNVSGGSRYLCDLSVSLAKYTDLKIYYADYKGGYPSQLLEGSKGVEIVEYKDEDLEFSIKEPTIIFTNSTKVIQIKKMNPLSKVLFWHFETIPCGWPLLLFNREAKRFIKTAKKQNGLIYHDWSARDVLSNQFHIRLKNKEYLQMYSKFKPTDTNQSIKNEVEINIAWLSRFGMEKVYSLVNIIENFAKYKTTKKKRLHIIGDGLGKTIVENCAKKYQNEIEIIFTGTIPHDKLHEYLIKNVDAVFAMGMSVAESAAIKIPSIFVQLSTHQFNDDAYYWLYDTKEYCVGITTDQKDRFPVTPSTMTEILDVISNKETQKIAGEKCYEYFVNNFSDFNSIVIKFLEFIRNCSFTYKHIKKICKYTPYRAVEQIDFKFKKLILCRRTKFVDRVRYYILGVPVKNVKLNEDLKYSKWGLFNWPPILPCLRKKQYVHVDNKSVSERKIKIFKKTFIKISKNKINQKYSLFGKIPFLVKRYNVGYNFPQSQFRG